MLFSSYFFVFIFFPVALIGYLLAARWMPRPISLGWLILCSAIFYAWNTPPHLLLLVISILVNFLLGIRLSQLKHQSAPVGGCNRLLFAGITFNLLLIAVFKYTPLIWDTVAGLGWQLARPEIVLPIGISFYTFQQIAYLADVHRNGRACKDPLHYAFFVSFFPQLIAGPIVHHRDILPQLSKQFRQANMRGLGMGASLFVIGLFKKVVLADQFATFASPIFQQADAGAAIGFLEAWIAALSYTLQLYFDFSGYSDMAIGLARMMGIRLPMNFWSPYKSTSIIEFWRRWHITLSRFLRDYLYVPLGGNRHGKPRRYVNLLLTMVLGGLWHGASWTFVVWGAYHGLLLMGNHLLRSLAGKRIGWVAWQSVRATANASDESKGKAPVVSIQSQITRPLAVITTFVCVAIGWVLFRAETFAGAWSVISSMIGLAGWSFEAEGLHRRSVLGWIAIGLAIVWLLPNTMQVFRRGRVGAAGGGFRQLSPISSGLSARASRRLSFAPGLGWGLLIVILAIVSIVMLDRPSEFIYYQF